MWLIHSWAVSSVEGRLEYEMKWDIMVKWSTMVKIIMNLLDSSIL